MNIKEAIERNLLPESDRTNRILLMEVEDCAEMVLNCPIKRIPLEEIKIGNVYQFAGDRYRTREVLDIEGEFLLIRTWGDASDHMHYKIHYCNLFPNKNI